jgi:CRP-like cAMP-binding protein
MSQSLFLPETHGRDARLMRDARRAEFYSMTNDSSAVSTDGALRNRLLAALPAAELERVRPHLEQVRLEQRESLYEPETPISHVYFPETAVISLVSSLEDGGTVEVGTAGCEGMAGLPVFLAGDTSSLKAFAQIPGVAARMEAATFTRLAGAPGPLHRLLLRYTQAFLTQVAQSAACNGAHLVEERCARWLLMTHDRVTGDAFPLTHEFLAFMLGVRRAGVTMAMRTLQDLGLVDYSRGWVEIVEREGLEGASCECYRVVRDHFDRLLPPAS